MNQDNQQNQPEKINLLHQDDIQPDIQKDLSEKPKKTGLSKWVIILIIILGVAAIGIAGYFVYNHYFGSGICINQCGDGKCGEIVCLSIGCPCAETIDSCPEDCKKEEIADPTADWQMYRNEEYGFELKYPEKYSVEQDTYGWPNSVVLFIQRPLGQSYDAQIEIWDNYESYQNKYSGDPSFIIVLENTDKYITINYNDQPANQEYTQEWQKILSTFKFIE